MAVYLKYEARKLFIIANNNSIKLHISRPFLLQLIIFRVLQLLYRVEDRTL